ncbi:hypothetical protein AGMMS49928_25820 [Spirochaetia bacterium]|nr:hypothetical protein AGMMS49928_25820 [Spirochaetia bacterium]
METLQTEMNERLLFLEKENKRITGENQTLRRRYEAAQNTIDRNKGYNHSRDQLFEALSAENASQKKFFRLLLENVQDIMVLLDHERRLVYCSDVFMDRAGISSFGIIAEQEFDKILPQYAESGAVKIVLDALEMAIQQRKSWRLDQALDIGFMDNPRQYRIYISPMLREDGYPEGALLLFYDLTEIIMAKEQAEQVSRVKSAFLAQTSHEIRTPMNAVLGMSELALRADSLPKVLEYVEGIKQAGQNLMTIINDILDISKIEAGTLEINPAPYSLASLLNDVINIIRLRVVEKPILFLVYADAGIPDSLSGDEARIRQILLNLLSNAVKYTQKGFIRLTAKMEKLEARSITLMFEVADSGIGIREEDIAVLFHRFIRLDMTKNHGIEGTGLGLAIARNLCKAMGGDISVNSTYGEGSVFSVRLPQTCLAEDPLARVENPGAKSVLCYEKNELYAESVAYALKNLQAPVKVCSGEEEFFRELEGGNYPFTFISSGVKEKAAELIAEKKIKTTLVILAGPGETEDSLRGSLNSPWQNTPRVNMPAYAVPVANALNSETAAEPKRKQGGRFTAPRARILVVDDISTNLVVTAGLLAAYRCHVDTCTSGAEAIRLVQQNNYDMIFMDHMMPEMDGIESTRRIRDLEGDHFKRLPIIALTANAITGMKEMFLEQGLNDYLSKPIEIARLDIIMETWIPADKKIQKTEDDDDGEKDEGLLEGMIVEGLDLVMGKERYREKMYLEVLRSYSVHTPALLEKLRGMTKETIGEYTIAVHGLKGATYGICANDIAKQAETLEHAARSGDLTCIEKENGSLIKSAEGLLKRIRGILEKAAGENEEKPKAVSPDPALLKQLLEACKRYRANVMEEILVKLESYEYEKGELVVWCREQVDNLEYDAIRERLEAITV